MLPHIKGEQGQHRALPASTSLESVFLVALIQQADDSSCRRELTEEGVFRRPPPGGIHMRDEIHVLYQNILLLCVGDKHGSNVMENENLYTVNV